MLTNEKVIEILETTRLMHQSSLDEANVDEDCAEAEESNRETVEALNVAIEALKAQNERMSDEQMAEFKKELAEAEPCGRLKLDGMLEDAYEHGYQQARYDYEVQPCEDAIDRQALRAQFNHLDEVYEGMSEEEKHEAYIYGQIIRAIDDAPPVTPKPKTGYWIPLGNYDDLGNENSYKCSECSDIDTYPDNYCPNCGTKME